MLWYSNSKFEWKIGPSSCFKSGCAFAWQPNSTAASPEEGTGVWHVNVPDGGPAEAPQLRMTKVVVSQIVELAGEMPVGGDMMRGWLGKYKRTRQVRWHVAR